MANDWLELRQHAETGIETIKAHFEGHAFDPHWHDSYLVGITLSGTQQFHCRRERHRSQPGDAFLLEPGEIHDGDAPVPYFSGTLPPVVHKPSRRFQKITAHSWL